jgi:hypothetical protein
MPMSATLSEVVALMLTAPRAARNRSDRPGPPGGLRGIRDGGDEGGVALPWGGAKQDASN